MALLMLHVSFFPLSLCLRPRVDIGGPTDIVFDKVLPTSAYNNNYITNFDTLKSMGDDLVGKLVGQLNL